MTNDDITLTKESLSQEVFESDDAKDEFEWRRQFKGIIGKARDKKLPVSGVFELTGRCNFRCKMCYVRIDSENISKIGREYTAAEWIAMGRQALEAGTLDILLTGGEVFLRPDFCEIYEALAKMGFFISIYTNASLLDDKILSVLKKFPPHYIGVTIYGTDAKTYESVCGNSNYFNKVIENFDILRRELKTTMFSMKTTLIKENLHDYETMKAIAKERNLPLDVGFGTYKAVRGAVTDIENHRLSPHELLNFKHKYAPELLSDSEKNFDKFVPTQNNKMTCDGALCMYSITWDGRMTPCLTFSEPYADPFEKGFSTAWEEVLNLRSCITTPDRCLKCKYNFYCGKCAAAVQNECGTFEKSNAKCFAYK